MHVITKATAWLTPGRRKAIYAALTALGGILVVLGVTTDSVVTGWVGVVDAVLSVAALALASVKARRVDWTAIYGVLAVLVGALKVVGILSDGQGSHILDVLAALIAFLPLLFATVRTTSATPTGEPLTEYNARHVLEPVPPEA